MNTKIGMRVIFCPFVNRMATASIRPICYGITTNIHMLCGSLVAYFINADKRYGRNRIVKNLITSKFFEPSFVDISKISTIILIYGIVKRVCLFLFYSENQFLCSFPSCRGECHNSNANKIKSGHCKRQPYGIFNIILVFRIKHMPFVCIS